MKTLIFSFEVENKKASLTIADWESIHIPVVEDYIYLSLFLRKNNDNDNVLIPQLPSLFWGFFV